MALLTGRSGTADPIEEEYFTCESEAGCVVVHMHLDAVDGIARDVVEGLTSPRHGVEAGGLLLGHAEPGDRPRVWIDRYQRLANTGWVLGSLWTRKILRSSKRPPRRSINRAS
jgi:hypothetical protein